MSAETVTRRFVDAINRRDPDAIAELMTSDHRFIDGMGEIVEGQERMRQGWKGYFDMVPDYYIKVSEAFESGDIVVMLGIAGGTFTNDATLKLENNWEVPAAWRAVVEGDKIKQWQVYADNEPIRKIMRREDCLPED